MRLTAGPTGIFLVLRQFTSPSCLPLAAVAVVTGNSPKSSRKYPKTDRLVKRGSQVAKLSSYRGCSAHVRSLRRCLSLLAPGPRSSPS